MQQRFRLAARAIGLAAGVLAAGAVLAAPKGSATDAADCAQKAAIQFSIDNAQCAAYPPSDARNWCQIKAMQSYAGAIAKCAAEASSAAVRRGTAVTGADGLTVQQEPEPTRPGPGKPGAADALPPLAE